MGIQFYVNGRMVGGMAYSTFSNFCHELVARNGGKHDGLEKFLDIQNEYRRGLAPSDCGDLADVFLQLASVTLSTDPSAPRLEPVVTRYPGGVTMIHSREETEDEWTEKIEHYAKVFQECFRDGNDFFAV